MSKKFSFKLQEMRLLKISYVNHMYTYIYVCGFSDNVF